MLAYGDHTTVQRHQQVRAQVIRWGKTKLIRDAAALHTGPQGNTDDLITVCSRRENLEARNEPDVTVRAKVKNVVAADSDGKPKTSKSASKKDEENLEKRISQLIEKRFNVLTDSINQMKAAGVMVCIDVDGVEDIGMGEIQILHLLLQNSR